jgi:hypothetical protein
MKEHNMRRTIALLATLLLSFGLTYADMAMDIGHTVGATTYLPGAAFDTIWYGQASTIDFYYENDDTLGGYSTGFKFWSPDGATWTWDTAIFSIDYIPGSMPPAFDTVWEIVTVVPGSRQDPHATVLDNGGMQLTYADIDEADYDTILWGGTRKNHGVYPGPLTSQVLTHLHLGGVSGSEVKTFCVDSTKVGSAGDFVFSDIAGGAFAPTTLWPVGGKCFKTKIMPNMPPAFTNPSQANCNAGPQNGGSISHCVGVGTYNTTAVDPESDPIIYNVVGHDGAGSATYVNGVLTYTAGTADVGNTVTVTIEVTDAFNGTGGGNTCDIQFTFTNVAPVAKCGQASHETGKESTFSKSDFSVTDPDGCDTHTWSFVSAVPALTNTPSFVGKNMSVYCTVDDTIAPHVITVEVSDGYATSQCSFTLTVLPTDPFLVEIADIITGDVCEGVLPGHFVDVPITMLAATAGLPIGGFDFLISYDASALTFMEAVGGDLFADAPDGCEWEYFTYRYGPFGNCGNGCPSGMLRIVGMSTINDGRHEPVCYELDAPYVLATMKFLVTNNAAYECQHIDIKWFWFDCGDNTISSKTGDTLFVERKIYDRFGEELIKPDGIEWFPGYYGIPETCIEPSQYQGKYPPLRFIDFIHGGLKICCANTYDARGDINVNGLAYEIADAVMFTNYFIEGLGAFRDHVDASIAASDVNADGITLSVADLVYLVRVIIGDALPYPKPMPNSVMNVAAQMVDGQLVVNYDAAYNVGAALLQFDVNGTAGEPVANVDMDLKYGFDGSKLTVLIYNIGSKSIPAGKDMLLSIPIEGTANLINVEAADYSGAPMEVSTRNLPTAFDLAQNYPNPFNPTTTMALNLPVKSDWTISIYNVAGQLVKTYNGNSEAGTVNVVWDGTDATGNSVASGIYFYKANARDFSATKKMVLMK